MFKRFSINYMASLLLVDVILIQLSLWLAVQARFYVPLGMRLRPEWAFVYVPSVSFHIAIALLWLFTFLVLSVYVPRMNVRWFDEFPRLGLAHTVAVLSLAGSLYWANIELSRLMYLYFYLIALFLLVGYRTVLRAWRHLRGHSSTSVARLLIAGAGKVGQEVVTEFRRQAWPGIELVAFLDDDPQKQGKSYHGVPVLGTLDDVVHVVQIEKIDEVLVALPAHAHHRLANLVMLLHILPVRIRVVPDYFGLAYFGARVENLGGIPLIGLREPAIDDFQRLIKRLIDIAASLVGLLVASPLMAVVGLAIKLEDGGPVFYAAERVGENGRIFRMWKFRSMVVDADKGHPQIGEVDAQGNTVYKLADDPRITRVGRFLRRTSIDELPQLINVLRGEMSLVGPRPELPWLVAKYEPWQRKRLAVPQGMTGWWQVNGRIKDPMQHLYTEQDLYYIQHYSLWLDIQILWKTISVVLRGKGAY